MNHRTGNGARHESSAAPPMPNAAATWNTVGGRWQSAAHRADERAAETRAPKLLAQVKWTVPFVAFLAYMFAITTYRLPIGNLGMMVGLFGVAIQRDARRFAAPLLWLAAFLFWCAVGYVFTPYPVETWTVLIELVKLWAIVFVAVNALQSPQQIRFFTVFFLGCFALYPLRGAFFNYFLYQSTVFGRAIWNHVYSNPNDLAALALLQLGMAAGLLATERRGWVKRAALAGIIVLPLLVLMTQSRGGFLALIVFAATAAVAQWRQLRAAMGMWRRLRVVAVVVCVFATVAFFAPNGVWERVAGLQHLTTTATLDQVDREGSARQRFEIWRVAAKIIRDHPVTGVGVGAYPLAHAHYARGEE